MSREYSRVRDSYDSRTPVFAVANPVDVPRTVDLRPKCSPVENQESEGSCTGHAFIGAMEHLELVQHQKFTRLSRNFVYYNERLIEGTTRQDAGAQIADGIQALKTYGVCEEAVWPYNVHHFKAKPSADAYIDGLKRRALKCTKISQHENTILHFLSEGRPIVFGIVVYESFENEVVAKTGIVPMPDNTKEKCLGGHAVLMVGYDLNTRMFLVRNSWGIKWGLDGYFWLPFAFVLDPTLSDSFWTVERST